MSNRKDSDRRTNNLQERNDLDMAITELHQTIVRLNKVIEQVKPVPTTTAAPQTTATITLATLNIPKVYH